MHMTHLIIDDFFNNPDEIREMALSLDYPPRPPKAYYPGRNSGQPLPLRGVERMMGDIVHEPNLVVAPNSSHAHPRLALEGDQSRASIHTDYCHWSALIYLTPDEYCQGGTHFFRHKKTGWDMAPVFPGVAEAAGYPDANTALHTIMNEEHNDRTKWTETMTIPMKYNRMVVFRGYLFHDAGVSFGKTPETGRLILPLFFENMNPTG
ncbi:MAG: DUF6445 family protein [Aquisalinus sp.]|nr:DUF6445 family protein [Aquisalinus sp.]